MAIARQLDRRVRFELMLEAVSGAHPDIPRKQRRSIARDRLKNLKAGKELPPLPARVVRPIGKSRKNENETYRRGFKGLNTPGRELFKVSGSRICPKCKDRMISANKDTCLRCA